MPEPLYQTADQRCDILIAGAGFAGALTALLLQKRGFSVCLLEKDSHPRFAIGESSTPIADLLLRDLSRRYHLPWLYAFSRYGSWQEAHPDIVCGIKRGFSYFKHHPGQEFTTDTAHHEELLVAASVSDQLSDTNWLRSDFDAFLVEKVKEAGITYLDHTDIVTAEWTTKWKFETRRQIGAGSGDRLTVNSTFFIDATGGGTLLNNLLDIPSSAEGFETDSYALFSHFDDLPRWKDMLDQASISTHDFPYDPDHSALHHILDEGWIWVLRFNDRRTSLGFALDRRKFPPGNAQPQVLWDRILRKYPSIGRLLEGVPRSAVPGRLIQSGRLQRRASRCSGPGWAALPHSAGFVDPLFSSGIAHSLLGIHRLTGILEQHWENPGTLQAASADYERAVFSELRLIDKLVAGCYDTMADFPRFQAWSMLYFAATIACEQRLLRGDTSGSFLGADNPAIEKMVGECWQSLRTGAAGNLTALVRETIAPFNTAGLMDPAARNMYHHTAAVL